MEAGIDALYLVIGKMVNGSVNAGFVPLPTLTTILEQAFSTSSLGSWTQNG